MNKEYYLLGDAARLLGCQAYQISYLLLTRKVPEPLRIGGRRVFTLGDLTKIAELLELDTIRELKIRGKGGA